MSTSLPLESSTAVTSEASKSIGGGPLKSSVAKNSWAWSIVAPSLSLAITTWWSSPPPLVKVIWLGPALNPLASNR